MVEIKTVLTVFGGDQDCIDCVWWRSRLYELCFKSLF